MYVYEYTIMAAKGVIAVIVNSVQELKEIYELTRHSYGFNLIRVAPLGDSLSREELDELLDGVECGGKLWKAKG